MDQLGQILRAVGYHAAILKVFSSMYLHIILSALFPIFTGSHASLSRPSSAAKPLRKTKKSADDADPEDLEAERKMEGMSPMDAVIIPITAGVTLVGLYYLIKYLEDPALLNKIMNWYLALLGTFALSQMLTDSTSIAWSFLFPNTYQQQGEIWKVDLRARKVWATKKTQLGRESPLPHHLATLPLPTKLIDALWNVKTISSRKIRINAYIYNSLKAKFDVGVLDLISFAIAIAFELYFNLISKPWWLTNLLGISISYTALQIMSPTTAWTGTLVLSGLFFYDIYFVFFTPVMVTVATTIDIPAKLLFPRPGTDSLGMLGLGDVVLPGLMIGFALRFDLFLFYLRKQKSPESPASRSSTERDDGTEISPSKNDQSNNGKAKYITATGGWGERFWTTEAGRDTAIEQGGRFSKTYFSATLVGYIAGMILTLGIMQVFAHAQPALLYLVPGVLCALWGTALVRGELQILWNFRDALEEEENEGVKKDDIKEDDKITSTLAKHSWMSWVFNGRQAEKIERGESSAKKAAKKAAKETDSAEADKDKRKGEVAVDEAQTLEKDQDDGKANSSKWDGQLISFSISLL